MSQGDFAKNLGIPSQQTYANYEKGRIPKPAILQQIAQRTGVTLEWLINGPSDPFDCPMPSSIVREDPVNYRTKPRAPDALRDETLRKARELNESLEPAMERIKQRALRRLDSLLTTAAANDGGTQAGMLRMSHDAIEDFAEEIRELRARQRGEI